MYYTNKEKISMKTNRLLVWAGGFYSFAILGIMVIVLSKIPQVVDAMTFISIIGGIVFGTVGFLNGDVDKTNPES